MAAESSVEKNKICEAIRKFRLMRGMSAKELASRTGIAAPNITAIEKGERVPKLEICKKIANALEVDPVEICGIELSELDEKRLLMKLLAKYADKIEIPMVTDKKGKKIVNPEGKSTVTLPIEFIDFALRYNDHIEEVKFALEGVDESDPRYELLKANAEDKLNYWLDMYPSYDAVTVAKKNMEDSNYPHSDDKEVEEARSKGILDFDVVDVWAAITESEMNPDFWSFQSEYIIPNRNEEWRAKHSKKDDE